MPKSPRLASISLVSTLVTAARLALAQPAPTAVEPADRAPPATPPSEPGATPPEAPSTAPPGAPPAPSASAPPAPAPTPYAPYAPYAAPYVPYVPPAAAAPRRDGRVANAHADRIVLLPTAYTHPKGTLYFSSNEIVLLQAGYAISDVTQLTLTGTPPLGDEGGDQAYFFDLSLKGAFLREGPLRLAAIGAATGILGIDVGNLVLGRAGAVAELCFDQACESSAALSSHVLLAGPASFMVNGVGATWRVADWAALLLEVDTFVPLGGEIGNYSGVAVFPGFRFPYRTWALDIAVGRALDTENEPEPAYLPWIAFTYRFLP